MTEMIPTSATRVAEHTAEDVNARIRRDTEMRVRGYATQPEAALSERVRELDREWDVERCLQTGASFLTLFGTTMGGAVSRKWFLLPAIVMGFFLQHGMEGWCPPLVFFRRLGVRTAEEISRERYALKALRGDFDGVSAPADAETTETSRTQSAEAVADRALGAAQG
jgi:hypothetical protein